MTDNTTLFSAIALGDRKAAETLTERFAAPLFRFCRLNFTDHYRAGEFVEMMLALWVVRLKRGDIGVTGISDLFREASRKSAGQWRGERGKGLSGKQRRILELMEELPVLERLALDLLWLEDREPAQVSQWLGTDSDAVNAVASNFLEKLSEDDTIKELLEHATIHQARQKQAESRPEGTRAFRQEQHREGREQTHAKPNERRWEKPDQQRQNRRPETFRDDSRGRQETRPPWKNEDFRAKTRPADYDTRGSTNGRPKTTHEERQKSRAGRRSVDPRKLDIDI